VEFTEEFPFAVTVHRDVVLPFEPVGRILSNHEVCCSVVFLVVVGGMVEYVIKRFPVIPVMLFIVVSSDTQVSVCDLNSEVYHLQNHEKTL